MPRFAGRFLWYILLNIMPRRVSIKDRAGLRTWIEIDRKAIQSNCRVLKNHLSKGTKLLAVVKSNAYGHDLVEFSREVVRHGADMLGVDSGVESIALRTAGIRVPILVLGYTLPEMFASLAKANVAVTISSIEGLTQIMGAARSGNVPAIHLKVDTGMHRQGFLETDRDRVVRVVQRMKGSVTVSGLYTHFAAAKDRGNLVSTRYTTRQLEELNRWREAFVQAGVNVNVHAGATGGLLLFPEAHFDVARAGIGLYGVWPSSWAEEKLSSTMMLAPVLAWKSLVAEIKKIPKGSAVGYDLTEKVSRDTTIAVIPVGYWHGYPRALSSKGEVLIRGKRARVLGRVCMDMIVVDVTDISGVRVRNEAVLIGRSGKDNISAEELAERSGTSAYEILTRLNPLMRRIYQ